MRQDHAAARANRDHRKRLCFISRRPRRGSPNTCTRLPPSPRASTTTRSNSTAQFLDWFKMPFPGQNIFEFYRRQFEQLQPPNTRLVRLKAPAGIGSVQTSSGRHITIGPDGIIEMSAEDAARLIPKGWTKLSED